MTRRTNWLARAEAFRQGGAFRKAERNFKVVLKHNPHNHVAHLLFGTMLLQEGDNGRALHHLEQSARLDPRNPEAINNYAVALRKCGRTEEGIKWIRAGLRLDDNAALYSNMGSCLMDMGEDREAMRWLEECVLRWPDHADGTWNWGLLKLKRKQWIDGWAGYNFGFRTRERQLRPYVDRYPEWMGEPAEGKTIITWGEQGLGDEILFASCVPDLLNEGASVIVDCHPRLEKIFRRSFPKCSVFGRRKDPDLDWLDRFRIDYHVPLGGLPKFYRMMDSDFPRIGYLKADPVGVETWKARFPGFRVGIAWQGGAHKTGRLKRSIPLEKLLPLFEIPVQWISVQYGDGIYEQIMEAGAPLHHDQYAIDDLTEHANLLASLDLLISVVQTDVHLAGAMDIPVWCLTPEGSAWKFHEGPDLIWHPSVRQYHRREGQWPLEELKRDLSELTQKSRSSTDAGERCLTPS